MDLTAQPSQPAARLDRVFSSDMQTQFVLITLGRDLDTDPPFSPARKAITKVLLFGLPTPKSLGLNPIFLSGIRRIVDAFVVPFSVELQHDIDPFAASSASCAMMAPSDFNTPAFVVFFDRPTPKTSRRDGRRVGWRRIFKETDKKSE